MCGRNKDGGHPLFVDGDGNCLFNALSVLSLDSRVLSVELHVRTCLERVTHVPVYMRVDSQDDRPKKDKWNREKEHDNDRRREDGEERMSLGKLSYHLLQLLHMPP